jgi:hypothetical protein
MNKYKVFLSFTLAIACLSLRAQTTVTTPGGTAGAIPKFSGTSSIVNSQIKDVSGEVTLKNLENVQYADQFPSAATDIGAAINAAYAALPSTGGRIKVSARAAPWTLSTEVDCNVPNKPCLIEGDPAGATTINYKGTGIAILLDWGAGHLGSAGVRNITLSQTMTPQTGTGIALGTSYSLDTAVISDVHLLGFNNCIDFLNSSFTITIESSVFESCENAVNFSSGSENDRIAYNTFSGNGVALNIASGTVTVRSFANSYDANSTTAISFTGSNITSSFYSYSDHYENPNSSTAQYITANVTSNAPRIFLYGGIMLDDVASGTQGQFIDCVGTSQQSCDTVYISGTEFYTTGRYTSQILAISGSPNVYISPANYSANILADCSGCSGGRSYDFPFHTNGVLPRVTATTNNVNWAINGNLTVNGTLTKSAGSFKIDHPLDPANKYLYHSFVESPDMMNIYNGVVTTDRRGMAVITLPSYFESLNRDFRYQLTTIGSFAETTVIQEIVNNRFIVKTSKPTIKISWQVTGIRHDAYANANRMTVEEDKSSQERGHYIHPELFNVSQP